MSKSLLLITLALATACAKTASEPSECTQICRNLVQTCSYSAFPDFKSCTDGCEYELTAGVDMNGKLTCVETADCDTFAIMECQHAYPVSN